RRRWLVLASVVLALVAGGAAGWVHTRLSPQETPEEPVPAEVLSPLQQRERALKLLVEQHLRSSKPSAKDETDRAEKLLVEQQVIPADPKARRKDGLELVIALGLFYLEQNRLEEADRFFLSLDRPHQLPLVVGVGGAALPAAPMEARLLAVAGAVAA